jgi:hypothetical protein
MPIFHADNENQFYLAIRLAVFAWQSFKVENHHFLNPYAWPLQNV